MIHHSRRDLLRAIAGLVIADRRAISCAPGALPFCMYSLSRGWSDDGGPVDEYITRQASPNDRSGVPQVVNRIERALRFQAAFEILIAKEEDNAFATVANGRKILVIDVDFLQRLNRISGTEWAAIQVIVHEVGHHIAGFLPDPHRSELTADYWSGQALQRLGSTQRAATQAILTIGTEVDSSSHPNKYRRSEVIRRGWSDAAANRIDYTFCSGCQ